MTRAGEGKYNDKPWLVIPQSPGTILNYRHVAGEMRDLRTLVITETAGTHLKKKPASYR